MRFFSLPQSARLIALLYSLIPTSAAVQVITSTALEECQDNSTFSASLFNIVFTPQNHSLALNVVGDSSIEGNVTLYVKAAAYGYEFLSENVDPCKEGFDSLCPLQNIEINFDTIYNNISTKVINRIPGVAYGIPDLDATVTVHMSKLESPNISQACVRSRLSNGKTTYQPGVGWATAAVVIVGLLASGVVSGLGYSNAGSHLAVYSVLLFTYFQSVATIGLCAVPLPPIVQAWTQNFQWSMGIINVGFLQTLATWYLIGTGGHPTTVLTTLGTKSVQVLKRGLKVAVRATDNEVPTGEYTVSGIKRAAFRANMEWTNLFLTSVIFLSVFLIFTIAVVAIFQALCSMAIKARWMKASRFQSFRDDYRVSMKGIIFRVLLIGFTPMTILCLWEFTQVDSAAEVALAVFIFFGLIGGLVWAVVQVCRIGQDSERHYKTAAYMLFGNAMVFNKWGYLYIQFRASAHWYIVPTLVYILIKGAFVGLSQNSGTTQAIALLIIEAIALVGASVIRPWMDKPTNAISISICAVNFVNSILLLIFTDIFNGPGLLIGVCGVIFFVLNAVFALVLLCVVLVATGYSFMQKNPESRYQPVADNRASFIKSQTTLSNELDALGATARGEQMGQYSEKSSFDRASRVRYDPVLSRTSLHNSRSPALPASPRMSGHYSNNREMSRASSIVSPVSDNGSRTRDAFPEMRSQHNSSPWQRGAGYDH